MASVEPPDPTPLTGSVTAPPVASGSVHPAPRPRILVVDDEPVMGTVLRRIFGGSHEVIAVVHGKDALQMMDGGAEFDVVLCDVVMPELSGPQVYEAVRERHPRLAERFVFMTGGALHEKTRRFLASISNPVLTKPFDLCALRGLVRSLVPSAA